MVAKERVRQFIRHVNKERGTTVILTTHDLEDINRLCERVIMIDRGKLIFDGLLETLVERFGGPRQLVVELEEEYGDVSLPGIDILSRDGMRVTYAVPPDGLSQVMAALSSKLRWADLSLKEPDVESTVRRIYEGRSAVAG